MRPALSRLRAGGMVASWFSPMKLSAVLAVLLPLFPGVGPVFADEPEAKEKSAETEKKEEAVKPAWRALFDGKTLEGWEVIPYAGQGPVEVKDGTIHIGQGEMLSGVRCVAKDLPTGDYEIELEARRVKGHDFFCCLTFPFRDKHASLVVGGWGGAMVGISSINFMDASENMTTKIREFETGKWYKIRLRATQNRIQAWIDDEDNVVSVNVKDKSVTMRFGEIEESIPLGISTFAVAGEARNVRIRPLEKEEIAAAEKLNEDEENDF